MKAIQTTIFVAILAISLATIPMQGTLFSKICTATKFGIPAFACANTLRGDLFVDSRAEASRSIHKPRIEQNSEMEQQFRDFAHTSIKKAGLNPDKISITIVPDDWQIDPHDSTKTTAFDLPSNNDFLLETVAHGNASLLIQNWMAEATCQYPEKKSFMTPLIQHKAARVHNNDRTNSALFFVGATTATCLSAACASRLLRIPSATSKIRAFGRSLGVGCAINAVNGLLYLQYQGHQIREADKKVAFSGIVPFTQYLAAVQEETDPVVNFSAGSHLHDKKRVDALYERRKNEFNRRMNSDDQESETE